MRGHFVGGRPWALVALGTALAALAAPAAAQSRTWRRLDLDITGDGQPEIFVARAAGGGADGDTFEVTAPQADGSLRPLGRLAFDLARGFRVDAAHRHVFVLGASTDGVAVLNVYALEAGFRRLERRALHAGAVDGAYEREARALEAYWKRAPRVETVALPVRAGEPGWRDASTGRRVAGLRRLDGQGFTRTVPPKTRR